jgi:threonine dehydrogenase-like Zn-dependent dehydrogenase
VQMEKGDILGHEFLGRIESMGPSGKGWQIGDLVVASSQIACGKVQNSYPILKAILTCRVLLLQAEAVISM